MLDVVRSLEPLTHRYSSLVSAVEPSIATAGVMSSEVAALEGEIREYELQVNGLLPWIGSG